MKWLSSRISFHRHKEGYTTVIISTKVEKWKESLIFGWLSIWTILGAVILYFLISGNYSESMLKNTEKKDLQLYLLIFLIFWAYFEYRAIKVYLWRKKGMEYFKVSKGKLILKKAFGKYGKAQEYLISNISNLDLIPFKENGYARVMSGSFWDVGNQTVSFDYHGQKIMFGAQLDKNEASSLKKFIDAELKRYKE